MGSLKSGATYIYERQDGVVYAREVGADPNTRAIVGYDWEPEPLRSRVRGANEAQVLENQLWANIRHAALDDQELKDALDRVKVLYYLKHQNKPTIFHHPV